MNATNSPDQDLKAGAPFFGVKLTWNGLAILAALALGSGLRLYFYLLNRSLWFDEALLALNLVDRSFAELLQPLENNQGAPLGFLMVQKAVISTLGNRDYLLRLFPLLGGLASLPLFYLAARRFLQPFAVQAALWLMAISPPLIYYASENKQYSTDVFFAVLLLWLAGRYLQNPTHDRKLVWLAICGAVALWFSHPSLFVLAGFLFAFCIESLIIRDRQRLVKLLAAGALGMASLALTYVLSLQHLAANASLKNYWQASFAPIPPWENWSWYAQVGFQILENPLKLPVTWLSLAVLTAGMLSLFVRQRSTGLLISLPILLTLVASALEKYPFGERLGLFMTPMLLLILAEGMDMIRIKLREINLPLSIIAFLALLIYFAYPAWQENSRMLAPAALKRAHQTLAGPSAREYAPTRPHLCLLRQWASLSLLCPAIWLCGRKLLDRRL